MIKTSRIRISRFKLEYYNRVNIRLVRLGMEKNMNPCNKLLHYIIFLKFYHKYNLLYIRALIQIEDAGGEIVKICSGWLE